KGRTVIIGTRVGPGDFYERLLEEDLVDNLIRYPAYDGTYGWLWPEQYSPEDYALLRKQAGESAWARNYMQRPTAAGDQTFTDEDLQACSDKLHRFGRRPDHIEGLSAGIIGWDPGFGTNALYYGGITKDRLVDLDWRTDHGLSSTAQMARLIDDLCAHWMRQGVRPAHLVVEDKAFQLGLWRDRAVRALSR